MCSSDDVIAFEGRFVSGEILRADYRDTCRCYSNCTRASRGEARAEAVRDTMHPDLPEYKMWALCSGTNDGRVKRTPQRETPTQRDTATSTYADTYEHTQRDAHTERHRRRHRHRHRHRRRENRETVLLHSLHVVSCVQTPFHLTMFDTQVLSGGQDNERTANAR